MSVCTQCGHELGVGRFCVNCGRPIDAAPTQDDAAVDDWRTGTAERPIGPGVAEPRYPLDADEAAVTTTGSHRRVDNLPRHRPVWLPWLLIAVVLMVFASAGVWLLLSGGDDPATTATDDRSSSPSSPSSTPTTQPPDPSPSETEKPSDEPTEEPSADPVGVARQATVSVPATAPPNQDLDGNQVRYEGRNMLDGVPETCWRMPGDGSGKSLLLALAEPTTLTSVGLVNGYAKIARDGGTSFDWYAGNRRVLAVEWVFDDGTVVRQDFERTRTMQSIDIDPVTTETVELRLLTVSSPGQGNSARNYTAISEVSLLGNPA